MRRNQTGVFKQPVGKERAKFVDLPGHWECHSYKQYIPNQPIPTDRSNVRLHPHATPHPLIVLRTMRQERKNVPTSGIRYRSRRLHMSQKSVLSALTNQVVTHHGRMSVRDAADDNE